MSLFLIQAVEIQEDLLGMTLIPTSNVQDMRTMATIFLIGRWAAALSYQARLL